MYITKVRKHPKVRKSGHGGPSLATTPRLSNPGWKSASNYHHKNTYSMRTAYSKILALPALARQSSMYRFFSISSKVYKPSNFGAFDKYPT